MWYFGTKNKTHLLGSHHVHVISFKCVPMMNIANKDLRISFTCSHLCSSHIYNICIKIIKLYKSLFLYLFITHKSVIDIANKFFCADKKSICALTIPSNSWDKVEIFIMSSYWCVTPQQYNSIIRTLCQEYIIIHSNFLSISTSSLGKSSTAR